jgi:hypothetical protein
MARAKAPKVPRPYQIGAYVPGVDAYMDFDRDYERIMRKGFRRYWTYRGSLRTAQTYAGDYIKGVSGFGVGSASDLCGIADHIDEIRDATGVSLPSGYAAAFRYVYNSPPVSGTLNIPFGDMVHGGWQHGTPGVHEGTWHHYDMKRAYYWALLQGLPDPARFYFTKSTAYKDAVFRVRLHQPTEGAPYPFDTYTDVVCSGHEIEAYDLRVAEVLAGVAFRGEYRKLPQITNAIDRWTFAPMVSRTFWGAWGAYEGCQCVIPDGTRHGRRWTLPARGRNVPWAHLILSRVRMRLWEASTLGPWCHVFTDSIITTQTMSTGTSPGDWRHVATYTRGVKVAGPGQYGRADSPHWLRYAGVVPGITREVVQ